MALVRWCWRSAYGLGDLWAFYFWTVCLTLVLGLVVLVGFALLDATFETGSSANTALSLGFFGIVYAIAYYRVYRGDSDGRRNQVS